MKTAHQTINIMRASHIMHTNVINTFNYHFGTSVDNLINYIRNRFTLGEKLHDYIIYHR